MSRPSLFLWFSFLTLILLPTTAGRFLLDLAGGVIIAFLSLGLILGGVGFIGWRILQSKMITCEICGLTSFNNANICPACGSELKSNLDKKSNQSQPASDATINITAEEVDQ